VGSATGLSAGDWLELARAQVALLEAQLLVYTRPAGSLVADAANRVPGDVPAPGTPRPPREGAFRIARAVRRAAEQGVFRPKCLVRSLALHRLLERRGISGSRIRVGVRKHDGRFEAHAWVELDGRVLGDEPEHTRAFAQLLDVHPVEG
jgi:hypothetical protein